MLSTHAAANASPFTIEQAIANVELARRYKPLTPTERQDLLAYGQQLAPTLGPPHSPIA